MPSMNSTKDITLRFHSSALDSHRTGICHETGTVYVDAYTTTTRFSQARDVVWPETMTGFTG